MQQKGWREEMRMQVAGLVTQWGVAGMAPEETQFVCTALKIPAARTGPQDKEQGEV